jgi:hypothetical protein
VAISSTSGSHNPAVNQKPIFAFAFLLLTLSAIAQDDIPTFKTQTKSALIWDENSPNHDAASSLRDPLTGNEIHKLSYGGIEVSSRLGYEKVSPDQAGKLLNYVTTVANNTESTVSVRYGGASVDGHVTLPLAIAPARELNSRDRKEIWDLHNLNCFKTRFAPSDLLFTAASSPQVLTVRPRTAVTISFVTKDPRESSVLCSIDGCHIKGTVRYYITVDHRDYVFLWPGRSITYCGD